MGSKATLPSLQAPADNPFPCRQAAPSRCKAPSSSSPGEARLPSYQLAMRLRWPFHVVCIAPGQHAGSAWRRNARRLQASGRRGGHAKVGCNGKGMERALTVETSGDESALRATAQTLLPLLLQDLRRHARRERRRIRAGQTLCTTALVHEAYLKLERGDGWLGELHFLRAAALAMRQALVDDARRKLSAKHGNSGVESLDEQLHEPFWSSDERLVELDEALHRLSQLNPRLTRVVECRFFSGYSEMETAEILGLADRTVRRDWIKARAWLYQQLEGSNLPDSEP